MSLHSVPFIIIPPENITLNTIDYSDPKAIGQELWNALDIDEAFNDARQRSGKEILPIIIRSNDIDILQLPWELLYHKEHDFIAKNANFALSRYNPDAPVLGDRVEQRPLRVLFFSTLPDDIEDNESRLAVENEQVAVLEALMESVKEGWVDIKIPNDGRFESLQHYIKTVKPDLVFLSGHSGYEDGVGSFLFEDRRGMRVYIDEKELADAFTGSTVECVVLSSCKSAKTDNMYSGLAQTLALRGIKNVIGMSDSIYDKAGATFAEVFIKAIARQSSIAQAVQQSREAIGKLESPFSSHWSLPLLITQDIYRPLVDWHFTPQAPSREMTLQKLNQIPFPKLFIGRRKEFRAFYNRLYDGTLNKLLIFGEGGIGKSAFVGTLGLILRGEGYRVFDYSLKHGGDFDDFLLDMELSLSESNYRKYTLIKERCHDEVCRAKRLVALLLEENRQLTFILDNLESIQNPETRQLEDATLQAWIEVLGDTDDVVLLMTSRWQIPNCHEFIQLGKPLKSDFLHYLFQHNLYFAHKTKVDRLYNTLGGNYRGTEFFRSAIERMNRDDEEAFLAKLSGATREIQIDMAIETILSHRTRQERELLHRLSVYPLPVAREGVIAIATDLPKEALDTLVAFSLVEESYNSQWQVHEYQISALVLTRIAEQIELDESIALLASEYQLWLFLNERKSLSQALIAHEALRRVGKVAQLDVWLYDTHSDDDSELRGLVLGHLGTQYYHVSEYKKALAYLEQSLKIRQAIGDRAGEGATLNNIASIYYAQGELPKALAYLEKSLKIQQAIGDRAGEGATLNNIASIYKAWGELPKALAYLEQSLKIQQAIGDRAGEGTTLNNIASIYYAQGELPKALAYLEKSLKIRQEIGDRAGVCYTLFNMGHIYLANDEVQEAVSAWVAVYQVAKAINLVEVLNALENLAKQLGSDDGLATWEHLAQQSNPKEE